MSIVLVSKAVAQQGNLLTGLDSYIEKGRQDWSIVGLAVAIVKNDSVIYSKGFGLREVGKPDEVDERTLFAIASNTKSFTAAAIGMLQDEGKLSLDDKVTKHLPSFTVADPYVTRELTIRDLLTHRSGLAEGGALWFGSGFSSAEILRRLAHLPVSTSFRSVFGYHNLMFMVASEVVGKVSGSSWQDFIKTRILAPLGMITSNTSVRELTGPNVATPHALVKGHPVAIRYRNVDNIAGAGSINSSAIEMAQYIRFHLRDGRYRGSQLVSKTYHDEMQTPQMITGPGRNPLYPMIHFDTEGLGLRVRDYYGRKFISHSGGIDGMLSAMAWIPEADVGVVVLTNTDAQEFRTALVHRILDLLIGAPPQDWNALYLAQSRLVARRADSARAARAAERFPGTRPSLPLVRYIGSYENALFGEIRLEQDATGLVLRRSAESTGRLEHWQYDTWAITWSSAQRPDDASFATFRLDSAARVASIELQGPPFNEVTVFTQRGAQPSGIP